MSVWPVPHRELPSLITPEGALVTVRITVEPSLVEDLLETLARVHFPINPELRHGNPLQVVFPAYASRLGEVRQALRAQGFDPQAMSVHDLLSESPLEGN